MERDEYGAFSMSFSYTILSNMPSICACGGHPGHLPVNNAMLQFIITHALLPTWSLGALEPCVMELNVVARTLVDAFTWGMNTGYWKFGLELSYRVCVGCESFASGGKLVIRRLWRDSDWYAMGCIWCIGRQWGDVIVSVLIRGGYWRLAPPAFRCIFGLIGRIRVWIVDKDLQLLKGIETTIRYGLHLMYWKVVGRCNRICAHSRRTLAPGIARVSLRFWSDR